MADIKFIGLHERDKYKTGTYAHAIDRMIRAGGNYSDLLDDIGRTGVTLTTEYLLKNRVRPRTKDRTLLSRRTRLKEPSTEGTTLVDTGTGAKTVSYRSSDKSVVVGVPDGYMAYHQLGRVPNAPRRRFLRMPTKDYILKTINFHWKKALRA